MSKKAKKQKSKLRKVLEGVFTGIFVVLLAFGSFLLIYGQVNAKKSGNKNAPTKIGDSYLPVIVLTNSMEPEYKIGTAVFVKSVSCEEIANNFNEGKTVDLTFYDDYALPYIGDYNTELTSLRKTERTQNVHYTITHRLFHVEVNDEVEYGQGKYIFFVQGINNNSGHLSAASQYQVFTENELYGVVYKDSEFIGGVFKFISSKLGLIILLLIPSLYMIISSVLDLVKDDSGDDNEIDPNNPLSKLSKKDQKKLKEELINELLDEKGDK